MEASMNFCYITTAVFLVTILLNTVPVPAADTPQTKPRQTRDTPAPVGILSIIPTQAEPGGHVTLFGSGFTANTTAYLGNFEMPTQIIGPKQLSFEVPQLEPGLYALFLRRDDNSTSKTYNFTVLPQKPVIVGLHPDRVDICSTGRDRDITISGRNFNDRSMVFFDGAAIRSRFISPEAISFTVPDVAGGLHQVQVKNSTDTSSMVMALFIEAKPEIFSVSQGEEFVNYYNLIINGRNFQQNTILVVDGRSLSGRMINSNERERIVFHDCNTIVYERHPYDTSPKNVRVQVVNPGVGESSVIQITAP
jgi:hypothetical protein